MRLPTLCSSARASLMAVLACAAVAATLSLGGGPADAAASEVETERLQGSTRYETAVAIAEAFVDEVEGGLFGSEVDTAIVTSGADEHFGYVLPARRWRGPIRRRCC